MRKRACGGGFLVLGLALAACEAPSDGAPMQTLVRDSAGVAIVEAPRETMEGLPRWTLTLELDLGGADAPAHHEFFRVNGARLLADGTIVVVNSGSREVRFFDPDGDLVGTVGRDGDGPEDFRQPLGIYGLAGDSLLVFDGRLKRVSVLAPGPRISRSVRLQGTLPNPDVAGVLASGDMVVANMTLTMPSGRTPESSFTELMRFDLSGRQTGTLGTYLAGRWVRTQESRLDNVRFDPFTTFAVSGDHVWIGTGRAYELRQVDAVGDLVRIARWWGPDRTVTAAYRDAWLEERLSTATTSEQRARVRAVAESAVFADERGAYSLVHASREGALWVRESGSFRATTVDWLVLDGTGVSQARVSTSAGLRVLDIVGDRVVGVLADELDVTHVVVYRVDARQPPQ